MSFIEEPIGMLHEADHFDIERVYLIGKSGCWNLTRMYSHSNSVQHTFTFNKQI